MPDEQTIELTIKWQNNSHFEVEENEGGTPSTIIRADENGSLVNLWGEVTRVMNGYIKGLMARIGSEMAEP